MINIGQNVLEYYIGEYLWYFRYPIRRPKRLLHSFRIDLLRIEHKPRRMANNDLWGLSERLIAEVVNGSGIWD